MDVLVTGAHGTVGGAIREHLSDDSTYSFTWMDIVDDAGVETVVADMRDTPALRNALATQDALVHLAINPDLNYRVTDVGWTPSLEENLHGIVSAFEAAVTEGVEKVIFASSIHAVGMYEITGGDSLYEPNTGPAVDEDTPYRPDSMYGVSKVFGEALGKFCSEYYGIDCYCLRLGAVLPPSRDHPYADAEDAVESGEVERGTEAYEARAAQLKAVWCSRRDVAHLVDCCLRNDSVDFDVFYGMSDNQRNWADISHAKETIGYNPRDDSSEWSAPPEHPKDNSGSRNV